MSGRIVTVYNLDTLPETHFPLWKRLVIRFLPIRVEKAEGVELHYKMLFNEMYLIKIVRVQKPCNCEYHKGAFN